MNPRGNILIPVLTAVVISGVVMAGVAAFVQYGNWLTERRQMLAEAKLEPEYVWHLLLDKNMSTTPVTNICDGALRTSSGGLIVWNPAGQVSVGHLVLPSGTWQTGTQVSPHLTIQQMILRQPTGTNGEPAPVPPMTVIRSSGNQYRSYLARLEFGFTTNVFGGPPANTGINLNVQLNAANQVKFCYPATNAADVLSYENAMDVMCNPLVACGYTNPSGATSNPSWWAGWPSEPAGTIRVPDPVVGFSSPYITTDATYATPDPTGYNYNFQGYTSSGTPKCSCNVHNSVIVQTQNPTYPCIPIFNKVFAGWRCSRNGCRPTYIPVQVGQECPTVTMKYYAPGQYKLGQSGTKSIP